MAEELSGYRDAVSTLSSASRGHWAGPSVPEEELAERYASVEGVDTGALRAGARDAVGEADPAPARGWIMQIVKLVGTLGSGMLANELYNKAQEWFHNREEVEEVGDAADRAADAVDETLINADEGTVQVLSQLVQVISELSAQLAKMDPQEHPEAFLACVEAGAALIDQAAAMIGGICVDRDTAVSQCFGALIDHGTAVCSRPGPELSDAAKQLGDAPVAPMNPGQASGGGAVGGGNGGGAGAAGEKNMTAGTAPATLNEGEGPGRKTGPEDSEPPEPAERKTAPGDGGTAAEQPGAKPGEPGPEKERPEPDLTAGAEPDDCGQSSGEDPEHDPEQESAPEAGREPMSDGGPDGVPDVESEPESEQEPGDEDTDDELPDTLVGPLGSGLLLMGVELLIAFLEQAAGEPPVEPAGVTEPVAEPAAEPEPRQDPAPAAVDSGGLPPEEELAHVPEPPPKPIPAEVASAGSTAPAPGPAVDPTPTPAAVPAPAPDPVAPAPAPAPDPAPAPVPASGVRIHKAGGW